MKKMLTILVLLSTSLTVFAADPGQWIKLADARRIQCDQGVGFNFEYDGNVLFDQWTAGVPLKQQCHAIVTQALQDAKPLYFKITRQQDHTVLNLSEILVLEDGFFVRGR